MLETLEAVRLVSQSRAGYHHIQYADVARMHEFSSMKSTFPFEEQISIVINDYC